MVGICDVNLLTEGAWKDIHPYGRFCRQVASNQGAVGVRYSYIICSAAENEFRHVETIPFLQWSLHRYGRSYGDRRDTYRRPDEGEGYNVQRAEKDMVQLGSV